MKIDKSRFSSRGFFKSLVLPISLTAGALRLRRPGPPRHHFPVIRRRPDYNAFNGDRPRFHGMQLLMVEHDDARPTRVNQP
jgi:hypothetical protein